MGQATVQTSWTRKQVLLNGVTATGAGAAFDVRFAQRITVYIKAASVTSGGTMAIQAQTPAGDWVTIDSRSISATGDTVVSFTGAAFSSIRANLTARTDGTYTVSCEAN
jgi:hypothetical protein